VYIYSCHKSAYRRMTWRSGGYLPTSPLRLHDRPDGAESAVLSSIIPIVTVAPTYVYSRILYSQKTIFQTFLRPFPRAHGARRPHFRIPLPTIRTLGFSPASLPQFYIFMKRWSLTSNVTPTPIPYSDSPRVTYPNIFSRLFTSFYIFRSGGALLPTSPLRQHHI